MKKVMREREKFALKNWQKVEKLFNVALKLTTVKMDLLVPKWGAKNKSCVNEKRNHAWKTRNCAEQRIAFIQINPNTKQGSFS